MPITQERQNIQDLRGVGFTDEQAMLLADKFEAIAQVSVQSAVQDLKSFIRSEFSELRSEMDTRFAQVDTRFAQVDTRFAEQNAHFERSLKLLLATILSSFVAVMGLAVAIIKLF